MEIYLGAFCSANQNAAFPSDSDEGIRLFASAYFASSRPEGKTEVAAKMPPAAAFDAFSEGGCLLYTSDAADE